MNPSLEITTHLAKGAVPCPNACSFCPQKKLGEAYTSADGMRSFTTRSLQKLLLSVPKEIDIHFSGFTEPFFNQETPNMIRLAKVMGHRVHLYTTLMGLSKDKVHFIEDCVDHCVVHFPDQRHLILNDELFLRQLIMFQNHCPIHKAMAMGTLTHAVQEFITKELKWPGVEMPQMISRAGNVFYTEKLKGSIKCSEDRWHNNVVMPDGNVYLCCMDYGLTTRLGNLFEQPYSEIWEAAASMKKNTNPPDDSICRRCDYAVTV